MKKALIIASIAAIAVGAVICVAVAASAGFSFEKLSNVKYVKNTYTAFGEFTSISIHGVTEDITLAPSEDGKLSVVCLEPEKMKHTVTIEGGVLMIRVEDERSWTDSLTFCAKTPKLTVYLPADEYESLDIKTSTGDTAIPAGFSFDTANVQMTTGDIDCGASVQSNAVFKATTGDIRLHDMSCGGLELSVTTGEITARSVQVARQASITFSTGDVTLDGLTAMSLHAEGGTGDILLKRVIAEADIDIKVSTGDVVFESSDAGELRVKTTTGRVSGTLLSSKVFITSTATGSVDVPRTSEGGRCEITTTTGSIRIGLAK